MKIRVKFCERVDYDVSIEVPPENREAFRMDPYGWLEDHFFELAEKQKPDWHKTAEVKLREVIDYEKENEK